MESQESEWLVWLGFVTEPGLIWAFRRLRGSAVGTGAWREVLLLVPDDEVEEVLGEVNPSGPQGAAQLLAAMAEGAGEVELFIATRERA